MVSWKNPIPESELGEWQSVSVQSKSGATLQGLFATAKTEVQKATVVLGHPMGKEAKGYFIKRGYTELLRNHGFNTLLFDINGFGESSHGNFSYFEDIVAAGQAAQQLTPQLPLGYFGISLGAQWATLAFTDENHPFKFAILESAATTLDEFWKKFPAAYATLRFLSLLLPRYARKINMIERIQEAKHLNSLLLIYSKNDAWVPFEMGERFLANSPVSTELWSVEDAKHAEIMKSPYKDAYQATIIAYFTNESERCRRSWPTG
ncbi:MAG: alpha/beta hydrolase [Leptolyngbya sp. SIO3F4]|nr:alpha/beta hydrolase [Leptolyngbya sp. SIO3F4]